VQQILTVPIVGMSGKSRRRRRRREGFRVQG
jgi:hypothetical protein